AWHLYVVRVARGARRDRDALFAALAERGIECSVHFVPLHMQPYYRDLSRQELPVAEAAFAEILSLPLWPRLPDAPQERVIERSRALRAWRGPERGRGRGRQPERDRSRRRTSMTRPNPAASAPPSNAVWAAPPSAGYASAPPAAASASAK